MRRIMQKAYRQDPMNDLGQFSDDAASVQSAVRGLVEAYEDRGVKLSIQISHLALLLNDAVSPHAPRRVGRYKRNIDVEGPFVAVLPVDDRATVTMEADEDLGPEASPEEWAESGHPLLYDFGRSVPASNRSSYSEQLELLELEDGLPISGAEFRMLTAQEARDIGKAALRDAKAGIPGAGLVLASLVSGRGVEDLLKAQRESALGKTWITEDGGIGFSPDVTDAVSPEAGGFILHLPVRWTGSKAEAEQWLSQLPRGRSPRLSRISRALRDALYEDDGALGALLSGQNCMAYIPLYYARFPIARLRKAWLDTLENRFALKGEFRLDPVRRRCRNIGSVKGPALEAISAWFTGLVQKVEQERARDHEGHILSLPQLTALEANLAASVLAFETARRPFRSAFEPLSQITGQKRPRVRIAGKGGRDVDDGRWVPLCNASRCALALWRGSLHRIRASGYLAAHRPLAERVTATEAGHAPLFFAWDGLNAAPYDLTASALYDRVGAPDLPRKGRSMTDSGIGTKAADNWARHAMRRELAARGLKGIVIDAFMGHGGALNDPMVPTSAAALADDDALRETIDTIWKDLGVTLPEPWK